MATKLQDKVYRDTRVEQKRIARLDPVYAEKDRAASRSWYARNTNKVKNYTKLIGAFRQSFKRADKLMRTPKWLTKEDLSLIRANYVMARWLSEVVGVKYHVDHIIPLKGKTVSGLHVPSNLCILLGTENLQKGNRY